MSRGRKPKSANTTSDWSIYFNKNIGIYLKMIITELTKIENDKSESGHELLQSISLDGDKVLSEIQLIEQPFEIPSNWAWCKLPDICEISTGNKDVNEGAVNGIYNFFTCAQEPLKSNSYSFDDDCILLPGNGANVGFVNRYKGKFELYQRTYCLHKINQSISVDFLEYYLRGFWKNNLGRQYGSGINYLRISNFTNFLVPIPPTSEQATIVEFLNDFRSNNLKLNGLYFYKQIEGQVINLHKSQLTSSELFTEFAYQQDLLIQLRQAFLREAMQGKLLKQEKKDGNAKELLEKIKAEKAKSGKKEKSLPPIKAEEIPFAIPENWVWCRLGDLTVEILGGFAFDSTRYSKSETKNQIIRLGNVKINQVVLETSPVFIDDEYAKEAAKAKLTKGDILITMTGTRKKRDYLFTLCMNENDFNTKNLFLNQRVGCFRFSKQLSNEFINFVLKEPRLLEPVFLSSTGAANQANIGITALKEILIPLPPLPEQNRIVKKLEQLMGLCDELQASIQTSKEQNEMLLQQVLREALRPKEEEISTGI